MDKHREVRTMKRRPKRPTDEQAMLIVLWESGSRMCLVHRGNGKTRRIEI